MKKRTIKKHKNYFNKTKKYFVLIFLIFVFILISLNFVSAAGLTPIARWDVVLYQRINFGETLNLGVVAFSKEGIDRVEFLISGQGYSGGIKTATEMSLNPQTGVWEYWVPLSASEFSSDGVINVEAVVYGRDGGVRDKNTGGGNLGLDELKFTVNPLGSLVQVEAWVAVNGSDSTGLLNDPTRPYLTIGKALDSIMGWRNINGFGNNVDGGIVYLFPGGHRMTNGGFEYNFSGVNEWITIKPSAGGTRENTIINQSAGTPKINLLKIEGISLKSYGQGGYAINPTSVFTGAMNLWIDDSDIIGSGWQTPGSSPIGLNVGPKYYTNSYFYDIQYPIYGSVRLSRNVRVEHIGGDAFSAVPFIINANISGLDPGSTGEHSDAWQSPSYNDLEGMQNWIVYNFQARDLHYQGIFGRVSVLSKNNAFVNLFIEMRGPFRGTHADLTDSMGASLSGEFDHFLVWHTTVIGPANIPSFFAMHDESTTGRFRASNSSFIGNAFQEFRSNQGDSWTETADVLFNSNHYNITETATAYTPGENYTTGDFGIFLDSSSKYFGYPFVSSVLLNKVFPLNVPVDADNNLRVNGGDVGSFEYISETLPVQVNCTIKKAYWKVV